MCGFVGCFGASKDLKDKVLLAGQFLRHRGDKKSKPKLCYDDNFSAAFSNTLLFCVVWAKKPIFSTFSSVSISSAFSITLYGISI